MSSRWFSDKEIICLISSLENLCSSALIIQHKLLSNILKRRTDRHRILKLMLYNKAIYREKKYMKEKSENIGFILDVQSNNGFHFSTMKW